MAVINVDTGEAVAPGSSGVSQPFATNNTQIGATTSGGTTSLGSPLPTSAATGGRSFNLDLSGLIPVTVAAQLMVGLTADPASLVNNQVWLRTDTNQICAYINGVVKRVTLA